MRLPVQVGFDLQLRVGGAVVPLSPRQGLRLAELLVRRSCRAILTEEIKASRETSPSAPRRRPTTTGRPN